VTEPDAREALVAEQNGHAPPRAATGDDYLSVVAHPLDEGQALLGRCPWLIESLGDPAISEEGLDTGTLSLQLCVIRGMWRHVKMIGTSARLDQDHRAIAVVNTGSPRYATVTSGSSRRSSGQRVRTWLRDEEAAGPSRAQSSPCSLTSGPAVSGLPAVCLGQEYLGWRHAC
jgi:hypothetical protein